MRDNIPLPSYERNLEFSFEFLDYYTVAGAIYLRAPSTEVLWQWTNYVESVQNFIQRVKIGIGHDLYHYEHQRRCGTVGFG